MTTRPPPLAPDSELDAAVRAHDEDRWLASRFAPAEVRTRLIAIYALNGEIARIADVVTQPALGDMRLAWWREAVAGIAAGKEAPPHPVLAAVAAAGQGTTLPFDAMEALIEARRKDLDAAPFASAQDLAAYMDATAGNLLRIAVAACRVEPAAHEPFIAAAAQAWASVGLLRAATDRRGRVPLPQASPDDLAALALEAIARVHALSARLPASAFPGVGYVALAPGYLRAYRSGRAGTPLLFRQMRLIAAAASGRL